MDGDAGVRDRPGQVAGAAEAAAVDEAADPSERQPGEHGGSSAVGPRQQRHAGAARVHDHRRRGQEQAAEPHGTAAVEVGCEGQPGAEVGGRRRELAAVLDDVPQPRPEDAGDGGDGELGAHELRVDAGAARPPRRDPPGGEESQAHAYGVGGQAQAAAPRHPAGEGGQRRHRRAGGQHRTDPAPALRRQSAPGHAAGDGQAEQRGVEEGELSHGRWWYG